MTMFASVRRPYISTAISLALDPEKPKTLTRKYLVMFRDGSGDMYLLDKVPADLQFPAKRAAYLRKNNIEPAVKLQVIDGFLEPIQGTQIEAPEVVEECVAFLSEAANGLGVAYLLGHNFVTEAQMQAQAAVELVTLGVSEAEALAAAASHWKSRRKSVFGDARKLMGVPGDFRPKALPVSPNRVDDKTDLKTLSKSQLLAISNGEYGLNLTKSNTIEDIIAAIQVLQTKPDPEPAATNGKSA